MRKKGTERERAECVKCMRHLCGTGLLAVAYIFYVEKSTMIVMAMAMAMAMAQQDNLNIYIHHIHSLTLRCHLKTWCVCVCVRTHCTITLKTMLFMFSQRCEKHSTYLYSYTMPHKAIQNDDREKKELEEGGKEIIIEIRKSYPFFYSC